MKIRCNVRWVRAVADSLIVLLALVASSAFGSVGEGVGPLFHLDTTIADVPAAALDFQTIRVTPNPIPSATTVELCSRNGGPHTLKIYAPDGRVIRTFPQVLLERGQRQAWIWDSRDQAGRAVSPGVYFCSIQTPTGRLSARALVLR